MATFSPAWLAGRSSATELLSDGFRRPADRARAVARAAERRVQPAVLDSLSATTEAQRRSRDALARGVAVVTGQQAGLFGGPLYTLYKAAAAIADARALEAETGTPCAPVFWLQNEDHDFAEIATASVLGADGAVHEVAVPEVPGDAGRSIGARRLGEGVIGALARVEEVLDGVSGAGAAMALLRACWTPERSADAAFREWIEALFARHGLLVLDPRPLVEEARPVHLRAIDEAEDAGRALSSRVRELEAAGFDVQVHVREGSPLCFVHPDGPDGPRFRVDRDGRLVGDGRVLTAGEVRAASHSTSALLRPILQDTWLPTACIVGGPGEIAYFAQLPPLYAHFGLPMPLIVPRARFLVVDEAADRLLALLGTTAPELSRPDVELVAGDRPADLPDPDALLSLGATVTAALRGFEAQAGPVDHGLAKAAAKTAGTVEEAVGKLVDRYRRVLLERDQVARDRLARARARLLPGGAPQERIHTWPWYGARHGVEGFVDRALTEVRPFDGELRELRP